MINRTLYIFPTATAVDSFNRAQAASRGGTLLGISAMPIKRFIEHLAKGSLMGRSLGDAGRRLLLKETVQAHYAGGGYYAELSQFPGFIEALGDLIGSLKQAMLSPDAFAGIIARFPHERRLDELVDLYAAYEAGLTARNLVDGNDVALEALQAVRERGASLELLKDVARIEFHHIYEFPPVQRELVTALAQQFPVQVNFPYDLDRPELFSFVTKTVEEFERHFDDNTAQLDIQFPDPERNFLYPLLGRLFKPSDGEDKMAQPAEMSYFSAGGTYAECEEIGRRVRALIDSGVKPGSIAVICRQLHTHGEMLADVFHRFAVPISYQRGTPLGAASLIQAVTSPYRIVRDNYARHELLGFLGSSYLTQETCRNGVTPDTFERLLNNAGYIDSTVADPIATVEGYLRKRRADGIVTVEEEEGLVALKEAVADIARFAAPMTVREHCRKLEWFIEKYRIFANVACTTDDRVLRRDMSAVALLRKVLLTAQSDISALGIGDNELTATDFLSFLRFGMKGEFLAGEHGDGVAVYTFQDVRGMRFKHAFVAGLNDGICPKRQFGHPLFKDDEKLVFNRSLGERPFRTAAEYSLEEPLLFYLAIGCAAETLTVSCSYIDSKGDAMLRSPYLDDLLTVLDLKEERLQLAGAAPDLSRCYDAEEIVNILSYSTLGMLDDPEYAAAIAKAPELDTRLADVQFKSAIELGRSAYFAAPDAQKGAAAGRYVGKITPGPALNELKRHMEEDRHNSYSATELETYVGCPFRYFFSRVLGVEEQEAPKLMVDPMTEGQLAHKILELFFKQLHEENRLPLRGVEFEIETLLKVSSGVFATAMRDLSPVQRVLWQASQHKLERALACYVGEQAAAADGKLPIAFEHRFQNFQACDEHGQPYYLNGMVDRIDLDRLQRRVGVVDYKLASNEARYKQLCDVDSFGVTSFQLPIYMAVSVDYVLKLHGIDPQAVVGSYALLKKGSSCGSEYQLSQSEAESFFSRAPGVVAADPEGNLYGRIGRVINTIKGGDFGIASSKCDHCPGGAVCRKPRVAG